MLRDLCAATNRREGAKSILEPVGPEWFMVEGDLVKTQRIAQNLLLNVIKYTEKGGVKVGWSEVAPQTYERWMLYVQDTGPGFRTRPGYPARPSNQEIHGRGSGGGTGGRKCRPGVNLCRSRTDASA